MLSSGVTASSAAPFDFAGWEMKNSEQVLDHLASVRILYFCVIRQRSVRQENNQAWLDNKGFLLEGGGGVFVVLVFSLNHNGLI